MSIEGLRMDPDKIRTVLEWPIPRTIKDILVFLGFANFYRMFIEGFRRIALPLTNLTKKDHRFVWTAEYQQVFETLKRRFTAAPMLTLFNPDAEI